MSDPEKGKVEHNATDPSDEAAASKLWAVYISEAEKYDKSLVESWKSDMEGMLIFAGLFSASLTAFLIESYKTLSPDSGDQTVQLLAQISQQLASGSNGTVFAISAAPTFTPSSTSLICNALWFISLGLSLTCALIATLLEQWARDFIHRADMRSAPLIRARIYSYLYYGMKRFNMHVVVDVIPLLLHASLLFFFAGLVAFLIPVNIIMAAITTILLSLVAAAYSILTFLPLRYMDCPYRTPLSGAFWRLFQRVRTMWLRLYPAEAMEDGDSSKDETMMEVIVRTAIEDSSARRKRDYHALVWTVKSLADEIELEPFVDALPEVLWRPYRPRAAYSDHIRRLANHRDVQLCARIDRLYTTCINGILSPEANTRRRMSCYKALWAVASLATPVSNQTPDSDLPVDFHNFAAYPVRHPSNWHVDLPDLLHYALSAKIMMKWSTFCAVDVDLALHERYLAQCLTGSPHRPEPPSIPTSSFLAFVVWKCKLGMHEDMYGDEPIEGVPQVNPDTQITRSQLLQQFEFIRSVRSLTPHSIVFEYLHCCDVLDAPPYQWDETMATISVDEAIPFVAFQDELRRNINRISSERDYAALGSEPCWYDTVMIRLCSFWKPTVPVAIPSGIICYLSQRSSDAVEEFLWQCSIGKYAWPGIRLTLDENKNDSVDLVRSLWALTLNCSWRRFAATAPDAFTSYMDALDAMSSRECFASVIPLIKMGVLDHVAKHKKLDTTDTDLGALSYHGILPAETEPRSLIDKTRSTEVLMNAKLNILAEFLEYCTSAELPYEAVETLDTMASQATPRSAVPVQKTYQIRLATSVHAVFAAGKPQEFLTAIVSSQLLDPYAGGQEKPWWDKHFRWITEPIARHKLTEALAGYESTLLADPESPKDLLDRLRAIIHGLKTLHVDPHPDSALRNATGAGPK
ncbi:hypothetical protein DFH06DRAFT_1472454 [Mycena polygramma]|nr:hypothetical protein DFH06DRAFT_1472454 [Mycena polygramma]